MFSFSRRVTALLCHLLLNPRELETHGGIDLMIKRRLTNWRGVSLHVESNMNEYSFPRVHRLRSRDERDGELCSARTQLILLPSRISLKAIASSRFAEYVRVYVCVYFKKIVTKIQEKRENAPSPLSFSRAHNIE